MLIDPPVKMANSKGLPFSSLPGFQVTLDASNCGAAGTKNNPKLSSGAVAGMEKSGRRTTAGDGPLAGKGRVGLPEPISSPRGPISIVFSWPGVVECVPGSSRSVLPVAVATRMARSEEHTSELQSLRHLVCRLL